MVSTDGFELGVHAPLRLVQFQTVELLVLVVRVSNGR
jgi:hypothetical protein